MNKQLIKDNKEAFNHWLDGGEILVYTTEEKWQTKVNDHWTWKGPYVINDEYVDFRKALAEGKTIQFNYFYTTNDNPSKEWRDMKIIGDFSLDIRHYRIKPDEPKFKVGQWITNGTTNFTVKKEYIDDYNEDHTKYELWQPQQGEWCWFWDEETANNPVFGQYKEDYPIDCVDNYVDNDDNTWYYIEPFIGTLPQSLKEK